MGSRKILCWHGFQYNSDKEDLIEMIQKIHTEVNNCEGLAPAHVDEETGRERATIFCRGKQTSRCYVTFVNAAALWKFLQANKGKKHVCTISGRKIWPKVDLDKHEEEMSRRLGKAYVYLSSKIATLDPTFDVKKNLSTEDYLGGVYVKVDRPVKRTYKVLEKDGGTFYLKVTTEGRDCPLLLGLDEAKLAEINTLPTFD